MNGYGKTSILEALYLGLYGKEAVEHLGRAGLKDDVGYRKFVERALHGTAIRTGRDSMWVKLQINQTKAEGFEVTRKWFFSRSGEYFAALDTSYRSSFSSSATYSDYLIIPCYSLVNARVGFRVADGWTLSVWSRNLLNKDYLELMSVQPGNSGLYEAQPGDPRTAGVTLRVNLRSR